MTPSEAPNMERVIADLDKLRLRLIDRGEYVTNEWADVADASLIGEALEALRELLAVREASEWRPISTAPRHYTPILLRDGTTVGEGWHSSHLGIWEFAHPNHVMRRDPTEWRPLPTPPRKETT